MGDRDAKAHAHGHHTTGHRDGRSQRTTGPALLAARCFWRKGLEKSAWQCPQTCGAPPCAQQRHARAEGVAGRCLSLSLSLSSPLPSYGGRAQQSSQIEERLKINRAGPCGPPTATSCSQVGHWFRPRGLSANALHLSLRNALATSYARGHNQTPTHPPVCPLVLDMRTAETL